MQIWKSLENIFRTKSQKNCLTEVLFSPPHNQKSCNLGAAACISHTVLYIVFMKNKTLFKSINHKYLSLSFQVLLTVKKGTERENKKNNSLHLEYQIHITDFKVIEMFLSS